MNPQDPTTIENQPGPQHRSTAAVVIGAALVIFSLFGLWIGIALTKPGGLIDLSTAGHIIVVVSILAGSGGGWLAAFGKSRPVDSATPDPPLFSNALPSDGCTNTEAAESAGASTIVTDSDDRPIDATGSAVTRGAAGGGRLAVSATLGLAVLIGIVVWHESTVPPSIAERVQSATHITNVSCYDQGEIGMGDGAIHPFYDCISWPPTSTDGPTTIGCYVYYKGSLQDVTSRLANDPNSWDTWNLFMAPPSGDPQGGNSCGTYTW